MKTENTHLLYLEHQSLQLCEATVMKEGSDNKGDFVVLDRTVSYCAGGGQQGDRGYVNQHNLLDVRRVDGEIRHYLSSSTPKTGSLVTVEIDHLFREQATRLHSAGHLIAAVIQELYGCDFKPNGAQHFDGDSWVRGNWFGDSLSDQFIESIQAKVNERVLKEQPIVTTMTPDGFRTVQIGNDEPVGCGGTHVSDTGQLGHVQITGARLKKKQVRVRYVLSKIA